MQLAGAALNDARPPEPGYARSHHPQYREIHGCCRQRRAKCSESFDPLSPLWRGGLLPDLPSSAGETPPTDVVVSQSSTGRGKP
jgi:hypothetical protein